MSAVCGVKRVSATLGSFRKNRSRAGIRVPASPGAGAGGTGTTAGAVPRAATEGTVPEAATACQASKHSWSRRGGHRNAGGRRRADQHRVRVVVVDVDGDVAPALVVAAAVLGDALVGGPGPGDRKSTRLNSSHVER